jgi:hypothetical protein
MILNVMSLNQSGKQKRKPSGGERAWKASFTGRNKKQFPLQGFDGENQRADVSASLTIALSRF